MRSVGRLVLLLGVSSLLVGGVSGCEEAVDEEQVDGWVENEGYVTRDELAAVATSGAYGDLSGAPDLSDVVRQGEVDDVVRQGELADVATSGAYGDLSGAPDLSDVVRSGDLSAVATSGAYGDLSGAPDLSDVVRSGELSAVARSGAYGDLSDVPDLSDVVRQGELSAVARSGAYGDLIGVPDLSDVVRSGELAGVARSGAYGDLSGVPDLSDVVRQGELADVARSGSYMELSDVPDLSDVVRSGELSAVARSGAYGDLSDVPWQQGSGEVSTAGHAVVGGELMVGELTIWSEGGAGALEVRTEVMLDQASEEAPFVGGNLNPWQTFTAGRTGAMVRFGLVPSSTETVTLNIYEGAGLGGPLLYTGVHTFEASGGRMFAEVDLDAAPEVSAGQVYTWEIVGNMSNIGIAIPGSYPGGYFGRSDTWDLAFRTYVLPLSGPALHLGTRGVGVGVEEPEYALHVAGTVAGTGPYMQLSDGRMKEEVEPLGEGLGAVLALRPVTWSWTEEARRELRASEHRESGFIAQEVAPVAPEAVRVDSAGRYTMSYGALVPVLTRAVQEQQALIERQREELDGLRRRLEALEGRR